MKVRNRKILINNIIIQASVGVYEHEKQLKQKIHFLVEIESVVNPTRSGVSELQLGAGGGLFTPGWKYQDFKGQMIDFQKNHFLLAKYG